MSKIKSMLKLVETIEGKLDTKYKFIELAANNQLFDNVEFENKFTDDEKKEICDYITNDYADNLLLEFLNQKDTRNKFIKAEPRRKIKMIQHLT